MSSSEKEQAVAHVATTGDATDSRTGGQAPADPIAVAADCVRDAVGALNHQRWLDARTIDLRPVYDPLMAAAAALRSARTTHDALMAALKALKLRIHFIGMPQETRRDDGAPDWRKEIALIESALAKAEGR